MKVKSPGGVRLLATPWTEAYQAPPSMGFSRQEYWSGVPSPNRELASVYFLPEVVNVSPSAYKVINICRTLQWKTLVGAKVK